MKNAFFESPEFFDVDGLVHTAWTECYWSFVRESFAEVARCSLEVAAGQRFQHHAPSPTSLVVQHFLAEKIIPVITQPPYCPDHAPSDFWLVPTPKMDLKKTSDRMLRPNSEDSKRSLLPVLSTLAGLMEQLCLFAKGSFFEGD
jgi:hypothetical protein